MATDDLKDALKEIRDELDEHLDALNQNTAEISAAHEYVSELDAKIEKLAERVDALQALLLAQTNTSGKAVRLTPREEDIFKVLINVSEPLTSVEIGRRSGLTGDLVAQTLFCLKQKGIPVLAQTLSEETFYALDAQFREAQRGHVAMQPVFWKGR
jgi:ABC-type transporter Mla subunit MlaD